LNTGTGRAATSTGSPVRGLRAIRVLRGESVLHGIQERVNDSRTVLFGYHWTGRPSDGGSDSFDEIRLGHESPLSRAWDWGNRTASHVRPGCH
jgi:hypothetical protein